MSIFPFISPEILESGQASELPMFREYAYDFENNRLLLRDGNTYLVEGNEALRIWISRRCPQNGSAIPPTTAPLEARSTL